MKHTLTTSIGHGVMYTAEHGGIRLKGPDGEVFLPENPCLIELRRKLDRDFGDSTKLDPRT